MNEQMSAQPCGCDPGAGWTCGVHAWRERPAKSPAEMELERLNAAIAAKQHEWRERAVFYEPSAAGAYESCAAELEDIK